MNIAIIGTGRVGSALGEGWAATGHRVVYGSRTPHADRVQALLAVSPGASAASPADAVSSAEVVLLAVPFTAAEGTVTALELGGKILIDATNTFGKTPDAPSGAEDLAVHAPGALVAKAFNVTGADNMRDPTYGGEALTMFVCGEARARGVAGDLARDIGFEVIEVDGLENAIWLENVAKLWVHLSMKFGRDIAMNLIRR